MLWVVYRVVIVIRVARNEYVYPQHRGAQPLNFFFFFCTTLIYIKRYKIAITIITVVYRYHWRYHSTLATTLLHDLHLWHRGYQDSTTIHAFTHTRTHTHAHTRTRTKSQIQYRFSRLSFFFKVTRNAACCLQLVNLGFLAYQSHRLEISIVSTCFLRDDSLLSFYLVSFYRF